MFLFLLFSENSAAILCYVFIVELHCALQKQYLGSEFTERAELIITRGLHEVLLTDELTAKRPPPGFRHTPACAEQRVLPKAIRNSLRSLQVSKRETQ